MQKMTQAQLRKVFLLAKQRGLDNELLHAHIFALTGRESLKELTISEAVRVIDSLEGENQTGRITKKQQRYVEGLCAQLGWVKEDGTMNPSALNTFLEKQYGISRLGWMSVKQASKLIEGLKKLLEKDKQKEAKTYENNTY